MQQRRKRKTETVDASSSLNTRCGRGTHRRRPTLLPPTGRPAQPASQPASQTASHASRPRRRLDLYLSIISSVRRQPCIDGRRQTRESVAAQTPLQLPGPGKQPSHFGHFLIAASGNFQHGELYHAPG